jgi:methionyl-tRNA synthetase
VPWLLTGRDSLGNKLLQDNKLDNRLFSEQPDRCAAVIGIALNQLHLIASLLSPYMPETANSMFRQLGLDNVAVSIPNAWELGVIQPGHVIAEPNLLFSTIPAAKVEEWRESFGGEEARRQKAEEQKKAAEKKAAKEREKERKRQKREKEKKEQEREQATAAETSMDGLADSVEKTTV